MSEYQYYEWQTIDRLLTPHEQAGVNELSSHIEVDSSKAVVTYDWGDFKHDPRQVLLQYFDAFFYLANWGSMRLMFRFPKGMLDEKELEPYWDGEYVSLETVGEYQVLDIDFEPEDAGWMGEVDVDLSDFIPLRAELLQGDYRLFYLTWLKEVTFYGEPDDEQGDDTDSPGDELEPPVPPGLKELSPALNNFVRAFNLDPFMVQAASEASPDLQPSKTLNYREWVTHLSRAECDIFLARLAEGDPAVGIALRKRMNEFSSKNEPLRPAGKRTLGELLQRARHLKEAEKNRQAKDARSRHIAEMKALAQREPQAWQEVEHLLDTGGKIASVYDQATALLQKLQQLSEFQDTRDIFQYHIHYLAGKYASRTSLMRRWRELGWI